MTIPRVKVHEQTRQWQSLLDSAGEGVWGIDLEGSCTFVNQTAAKTFGFDCHEVLGRNMHELVHHHYADGSTFPRQDCSVDKVIRTQTSFRQCRDTLFRKDGSSFVAEVSAEPLTIDGVVVGAMVMFHEVPVEGLEEALHAARELVNRKTAELDAVLEGVPHAVYIAILDEKLRSNRQAKEMSGEGFPHEFKTLGRAMEGEASTETLHTAADRWIRSSAEPIFLKGELLGGVAVNTDVTWSRQQDEALRKLEKLAAVGQLASSIAHEINNPLEAITNLLYLIRQSESMREVQQYVTIAQEELSRVTQITLQTLRFHRQKNRPAEMDIGETLQTLLALYAGRVLVRQVKTEIEVVGAVKVLALEGEIRQVMNNLMRNALDAMSTGGRLLVRAHAQEGWHNGSHGVRFAIADTGEGIRPNILPRLFEPFQTTKEVTGTGLGLWVSKAIIEKHGGKIRYRSRVGRGTVFTVWLPVDGPINSNLQAS